MSTKKQDTFGVRFLDYIMIALVPLIPSLLACESVWSGDLDWKAELERVVGSTWALSVTCGGWFLVNFFKRQKKLENSVAKFFFGFMTVTSVTAFFVSLREFDRLDLKSLCLDFPVARLRYLLNGCCWVDGILLVCTTIAFWMFFTEPPACRVRSAIGRHMLPPGQLPPP
ncbi:MAG: hypothetical protein ABSH14_11705 [Verrucomicrobiia bacterium]|jgi:hypothetical protein